MKLAKVSCEETQKNGHVLFIPWNSCSKFFVDFPSKKVDIDLGEAFYLFDSLCSAVHFEVSKWD